jgi:DNA-binding MarR family transcriptional regulator
MGIVNAETRAEAACGRCDMRRISGKKDTPFAEAFRHPGTDYPWVGAEHSSPVVRLRTRAVTQLGSWVKLCNSVPKQSSAPSSHARSRTISSRLCCLMKTLRQGDNSPRSRLAGIDLPAMTVILERLESLGFVTRQRDVTDRRRYSVIADPEQVKRVDAMYRKYSRKMAALLETYDDAAFEALLKYLNDASALIGEEIAQSARDSRRRAKRGILDSLK